LTVIKKMKVAESVILYNNRYLIAAAFGCTQNRKQNENHQIFFYLIQKFN